MGLPPFEGRVAVLGVGARQSADDSPLAVQGRQVNAMKCPGTHPRFLGGGGCPDGAKIEVPGERWFAKKVYLQSMVLCRLRDWGRVSGAAIYNDDGGWRMGMSSVCWRLERFLREPFCL